MGLGRSKVLEKANTTRIKTPTSRNSPDFSRRPSEDLDQILRSDKSIQENLKKLDFTVRSIKPVINKNSAAFDTLRNRYLIQRSLRDEHGNEVVKPPPGKLFISNLQEILSSRSSRSDSAKNHFERTAKEYGTTASDLSLVSRYVNVYRVSGGTKNEIYGTWAEV